MPTAVQNGTVVNAKGLLSMQRYKVFFHLGEELNIKTRVEKGWAWVDEKGLNVASGTETFTISGVSAVELFRLHGSTRVIRVEHSGGRLFLSVVRWMVGQFAVVNFLKTGAFRDRIAELIQHRGATK